MLYFIYQFLQGIAHNVFTAVEIGRQNLEFVSSIPAEIGGFFTDIDFPPVVLAVLTLIFVLAFIDKIIHVLVEVL